MVVHQFLDLSLMFQSPRSGKFVSDENNKLAYVIDGKKVSIPQIGEICIRQLTLTAILAVLALFQSPRSGKFVSDMRHSLGEPLPHQRFNPLDRGNLYQIHSRNFSQMQFWVFCFNPLDRGNLYQICWEWNEISENEAQFQSPRSGKFVSDTCYNQIIVFYLQEICFNPLDRGNLYQI